MLLQRRHIGTTPIDPVTENKLNLVKYRIALRNRFTEKLKKILIGNHIESKKKLKIWQIKQYCLRGSLYQPLPV